MLSSVGLYLWAIVVQSIVVMKTHSCSSIQSIIIMGVCFIVNLNSFIISNSVENLLFYEYLNAGVQRKRVFLLRPPPQKTIKQQHPLASAPTTQTRTLLP